MGDWYLGEIRLFSMAWAPEGWALCDGREMQIKQYPALFALLGTAYGGDGKTTFNLPDLRGRVPVGVAPSDQKYQRGVKGGSETVTLQTSQIPAHSHSFQVMKATGTSPVPTGNFVSSSGTSPVVTLAPNLFSPLGTSPVPLNVGSISPTGESAGHNNMQPSLVVNYCIAIQGTFPPRN